jgi:hypothetical protein
MKCPVDGSLLTVSERQGVEIDYCPQCRGVWLDRGELDKIVERMAPAAPVVQPRIEDRPRGYGDDYTYKSKRKKSFFEELFD